MLACTQSLILKIAWDWYLAIQAWRPRAEKKLPSLAFFHRHWCGLTLHWLWPDRFGRFKVSTGDIILAWMNKKFIRRQKQGILSMGQKLVQWQGIWGCWSLFFHSFEACCPVQILLWNKKAAPPQQSIVWDEQVSRLWLWVNEGPTKWFNPHHSPKRRYLRSFLLLSTIKKEKSF